MTDEEKSEEYADECFKGNDKASQYYRTILITGYLDGLAEGRKEQENKDKGFCESFCMKGGRIAELEKENAELEKQIDKMKCCGNCKYRIKKNLEGKIWVELCEKSYIKNKCEEWELVE